MGITDGSYVCGRCGEWQTSCSLCSDLESHLVAGPEHPTAIAAKRKDEAELDAQTRSIRYEADKRAGWFD
jgi:hypothetical protein